MTCTECGHRNRPRAEFCGACGGNLHRSDVACAACGASNPPGSLFCDACGTKLKARTLPAEVSSSVQPDGPAGGTITQPRQPLAGPITTALSGRLRSRAFLASGVLAVLSGQLALVIAGPRDGPPVLALFGLALGTALFALGSSGGVADERDGGPASPSGATGTAIRRQVAIGSAVLGLLMVLVLLIRLARGSESGLDLLLWLAAISAFAVPLAWRHRLPRVALRHGIYADVTVVLLLVGIFLALNVRDLGDWYYSAIGDEYAFYQGATGILDNGISRPFSQAGVYGEQPVLSSAYQAVVMAVFGRDNVGWRFASVLSIALTIPGIYVIGLALGDRKVAIISATLFAFSHYLFAYAHTGYNNVHALAPAVWALAFLVMGMRTRSPLLFFVSGMLAGLGFYTYFAARAAAPIILLIVLANPAWRRQLPNLWPLGLGFVLAVAPIFAANGGEVFSRMFSEIPGGYSSDVSGPAGERVLANLSNNLLAFNYNSDVFHYVSGSLLDPISAALMALGVGLALGRMRHASYRTLLIWALVAVATTGVLSPYPQVSISRLSFAVPPLVLLAGFAARHTWESIPLSGLPVSRRYLGVGAIVAMSLLVLYLNVARFWSETPELYHLTQEAVSIGALRSEVCGDDPERTIVVGRETEPLLKPALGSYYPDGRVPVLIDHDELEPDTPFPLGSARCVIFANPHDVRALEALAYLSLRYEGGQTLTFSDRAGKGSVTIFALDGD